MIGWCLVTSEPEIDIKTSQTCHPGLPTLHPMMYLVLMCFITSSCWDGKQTMEHVLCDSWLHDMCRTIGPCPVPVIQMYCGRRNVTLVAICIREMDIVVSELTSKTSSHYLFRHIIVHAIMCMICTFFIIVFVVKNWYHCTDWIYKLIVQYYQQSLLQLLCCHCFCRQQSTFCHGNMWKQCADTLSYLAPVCFVIYQIERCNQ